MQHLATTIPDALRRAAYVLDLHGWVQGAYGNHRGFCAVGALRAACWGTYHYGPSQPAWSPRRDELYKSALDWLRTLPEIGERSVADWNDDPSQDADTVTATLRRAAAEYAAATAGGQ